MEEVVEKLFEKVKVTLVLQMGTTWCSLILQGFGDMGNVS